MKRAYTLISTLFMIILLTLAACNQNDSPDDEPAEVVEAASPSPTPSPTATVPPPTATPTAGPPTATATPVLPPSPSPSPTPESQTYTVQANDTLLAIAAQFGVTTDALAAANGINEDDFLQLGQELTIPVIESTPDDQNETGDADENESENENETSDDQTPADGTTAEATNSPAAEADVAPPPPPSPGFVYTGPPLPDISHPANVNPLTGLPVDDPAVLQRRPLIVRIGNDTGARRSQVGLNQADVVYEEIAEWWVTRFSAIFLTNTPNTIAPVRSARLINVQLAPQYQAALAHSGGSDPVRWEISQAPITNLDEFYNPAPYFYRPNQGWQTRLAIDAEAARTYMVSQGLEAAVNFQGFTFSETPPGGEPAPDIYVPYPRSTSFTEWHYDEASGNYLRWINGAPLIDAGDGQQVAADNVVIYFAEHQATDIVEDANGATSIRPIINGVGPAWFFRDGQLTRGSWQTDGQRAPYFTTTDGSAYALKPGNTWVEVVPSYFTIGLNSADEASSR